MSKKIFGVIFSQRFIVAVLIIAQLALLTYALLGSSLLSSITSSTFRVMAALLALRVITRRDKGAYKLTWVYIILAIPLMGGSLYLIHRLQAHRRYDRYTKKLDESFRPLFMLPGDGAAAAVESCPQYSADIRYLQEYCGFPVYDESSAEYLTPGEDYFGRLLEELEKAEHYIFLEYFIIDEGLMWNSVLEILKRKAAAGVKVRLIYDDVGCIMLLPKDYPKTLESYGIECRVYNPFKPMLTTIQNNRDHRKICSIDGRVAFTGGINLADEYINEYEKYGHWKDAGVMIKGKAAWSLTLIHLKQWESLTGKAEDRMAYYPGADRWDAEGAKGFIQPYADSPMDDENISEHVYMRVITGAKRYLYINTPYLIIDDSMISALCLAAKSGVDVRIVTPSVPDKKFVHFTTRSYYRDLIRGGVKIYEYTKGFNHSKTFVSDDTVATVGTVNLDFRSLFLHFECGVWMCGNDAVHAVRDDFLKTLSECTPITAHDCQCGPVKRMAQDVMRLFAPLM